MEFEVTPASSQPRATPARHRVGFKLPADATGTAAVIHFGKPHHKAKWLGWLLQGTIARMIACYAATESPSASTVLTCATMLGAVGSLNDSLCCRHRLQVRLLEAAVSSWTFFPKAFSRPASSLSSHSCRQDSPKVRAFEASKTVRYCTLPGCRTRARAVVQNATLGSLC